MKVFKLRLRVLILVALIAIFGAFTAKDSNAAAPNYMGDFCWEITENGSIFPPFTVMFGVTLMGDNHYQFNGEGGGGTGDIVGNTINFVLYKATFDDDNGGISPGGFRTGIINAILDVNTLSGPWKVIDHFSDAQGGVVHQPSSGTMTSVPCP